MKYYNNFLLGAICLTALASCADNNTLGFAVSEPDSLANVEYLKKYDVLKNYVDRTANPNFKLGTGATVSEYNQKGLMYRLINSNYDEMTAGYGMKHGAVVQSDGSLDLSSVREFLSNAQSAGVSVFGHTLCWHANQNATYLNSLIAPTAAPGGSYMKELVTNGDFEGTDMTCFPISAAAISGSAAGKDGTGKSFSVKNPAVQANDWGCQWFLLLPQTLKKGDIVEFSMDIRADAESSVATQSHGNPGSYMIWYAVGTIPYTTSWTHYSTSITIDDKQDGMKSIAFNLGNVATTYYMDNVSLKVKAEGGFIEKTAAQKDSILNESMKSWIKQMKEACTYVHAWDVVNEPMADWPDVTKLKTGVGKTLSSDEFYWQDYMGKDYAVRAFKYAAQYGNTDDKLFINDYGLETNLAKCRGLIKYVNYIESQGARVDGIATQMHVSVGSVKRDSIVEMFKLLAATRKLVKISELDMGVNDGNGDIKTANVTNEQLKEQADLYKFIVDAYFANVPAAQRYGITHWSPLDSPTSSSWRGGEPIGLWNENYNRKHAYAGFANGLAGKVVFSE